MAQQYSSPCRQDALPSFFSATTEAQLARVAVDLGATEVDGPLSVSEQRLLSEAAQAPPTTSESLEALRLAIQAGADPLGDLFCAVRLQSVRRKTGAFYTPPELVSSMVSWALSAHPDRIVDAGCGSGRFASEIARRGGRSDILAIDIDPLATILTRATMAALGRHDVRVVQEDYTTIRIPTIEGRTAFVGNPPYVRHHDLSPVAKAWARDAAASQGYRMSGLAGLHAHFYLATLLHARKGDVGCFVTSAEWLDVGYGAIIRRLLLHGLGGLSLHVLEPTAIPFEDAMVTAAVACFEVGAQPPHLYLSYDQGLDDLSHLGAGRPVPRSVLVQSSRWSPLLRADDGEDRRGLVPLGDIARVHRGVVTGSNDFFILTRAQTQQLGVQQWCRPAITRAQEILTADGVVRDGPERRMLLDVPADVDRRAHPELDAYLRTGEEPRNGKPPICEGYICRHRRPWWRLGTPPPAPIILSYMARQAPAFAFNPDGLVIINIAHGLYPKRQLDSEQVRALAEMLNAARHTFQGSGRTYHGGMEKFEPREVEALSVPAGPWT